MKVKSLGRVWLSATPWTVAYQAHPSVGFSRQEYWSGLPFPSQGDLSNPGIEPRSPAMQADALPSKPPAKPTSSFQSVQEWGRKSLRREKSGFKIGGRAWCRMRSDSSPGPAVDVWPARLPALWYFHLPCTPPAVK